MGETLVADGWNVAITVKSAHLIIKANGREHKLPRAHHGISRLLVLADTGYVSLNALRWCRDNGIAVIGLNPFAGTETFTAPTTAHADARLIRAQANLPDAARLAIAHGLIRARIAGQLANVERHYPEDKKTRARLERCLDSLDLAGDVGAVLKVEADAARGYFDGWAGLRLRFATRDADKVPAHWHAWPGRQTGVGLGPTPRQATHPANALLNYGNAVALRLAVVACRAVGLSPALGVMHEDTGEGLGLALDILEVARAHVEDAVLQVVAATTFTRDDFAEVRRGEVVLREALCESLGRACGAWEAPLTTAVEDVAAVVAGAGRGRVVPRTAPSRRGRRGAAPLAPPAVPPAPRCRECGGPAPYPAHPHCLACDPAPRCQHPTCGRPLPDPGPTPRNGVPRRWCSERCRSGGRKRERAAGVPAPVAPCACGCGESSRVGTRYATTACTRRVMNARRLAAYHARRARTAPAQGRP